VLLTFDLTQAIIEPAPPGLVVTPGTIPDRSVDILLSLANEGEDPRGKKVAGARLPSVITVVHNTI